MNICLLGRQRDLTGFSANAAILNPFKIIFFILNLFFSVTRILNWFVQNPFEKEIIYSKQGHIANERKRDTTNLTEDEASLWQAKEDYCLENRMFSPSILIFPPISLLSFTRRKQIILKSESTEQRPLINQPRRKQTVSKVRIANKNCKLKQSQDVLFHLPAGKSII